MTISMHSLLQKTEVVKEVSNNSFPRTIQIRRDITRYNQPRYIVLWRDEFETKRNDSSAESYYIEPIAELLVKNDKLRYAVKPSSHHGVNSRFDEAVKCAVNEALTQELQLLA
ncbi:hypothetical protein [Aeromonas encheleia]